MRTSVAALTALSGLAFILGSVAQATPIPDPVYTFCETEDNDLCSTPQILDANLAAASVGGGGEGEFVRDCFYLTGKLQEDCVWDIEPKCAIFVYDKPAPCRTTSGAPIPGNFYEPVLRKTLDGSDLTNVVPLSDHTIRLGVAALQDAFDGTINGLANNGRHGETGEVTVKIFYHTGGDGQPRGDQPDQMYVFRFGGPDFDRESSDVALGPSGSVCLDAVGSDALRVAFIIPSNVSSVDIVCCNNTGQQPLCYDVDNYKVTNLLPSRAYCIEVIGGLEDDSVPGCECGYPTDTLVGIFDKNCNLIDFNDNKVDCQTLRVCEPDFVYSKICTFAEVDGSLRFAVTGERDTDFNGLDDGRQQEYFDFLERLRIIDGLNYTYRQGASTKDASVDEVNRYPRFIWDPASNQNPHGEALFERFDGAPEAWASHGECGGYCIKIQLAEHIDPSDRPPVHPVMDGARADINSDGVVNASDLALLLSYWGIVN